MTIPPNLPGICHNPVYETAAIAFDCIPKSVTHNLFATALMPRSFVLSKLRNPYIIKRIFVERLTEPLHLNLISLFIAIGGSTRSKIAFDLITRQHLAFGLLRAADDAKQLGITKVTAVEFGVATGAGLFNMCEIARRVTVATGIEFSIVGFDSGTGMPPARDYRDHPEYFTAGDFPSDADAIKRRLPSNAQLIVGDVTHTVPEFVRALHPSAPLGLAVIDVDYYWSTKECLPVFLGPPECYLPVTTVYLDDVEFSGMNKWCGELLAIEEFNAEQTHRKIAPMNFLRPGRIFRNAKWIDHMFSLHVLDHPVRSTVRSAGSPAIIANPYL